jgi:hypothetical protein
MGDVETCELCDGTGSVIADQAVTVPVDIKVTVLEARYSAGLPLFRPDDGFIPPDKGRGGPDWDAFFAGGDDPPQEFEDDAGDEDLLWDVHAKNGEPL